MPIKFWNIGKANAEISSSHEVADAALAAAKVLTLKVDGKDVPCADAPLAGKISALVSLVNAGEKSQDVSELIATNGQIAAQVETLEGENAKLTASNQAQTQKISQLEADLTTARASVSTLTAEKATQTNLLDASNKEVSRMSSEANRVNREVSQMCVSVGCLDLKGADDKPLAKDASEADRLTAADKLPVADKLKSFAGAVHAAASKVGIVLASVPSGGAAAPANANKKLSIDDQVRQAKALKK